MICPKCGRNIPGNVCPYCDGPQIEDHTDDYNRRRKEYEDSTEKTYESGKSISSEPEKEEKKVNYRKMIIPLAIAAAAGVVAIVSINVIRNYRPAPDYNNEVFYAAEGNYYRMSGADAEKVGESKNVFFSGDGSRFYRSDAIEGLVSSKGYMVDNTMSDDNGNYFACALYDPSTEQDNYKLFVWKNDGEPMEKLSSNGMIGIKYISEAGKIFYTNTDVITDELGTGNTSFWCCDFETDNTDRLEEAVDSVYFYSKTGSLITRNSNDALYKRELSDLSAKIKIADDIDDILIEDIWCNNYFKKADRAVNGSHDADRICFISSGRIHMYDLTSGESVDIGSSKGSDARVCYDDVNRVVYLADSQNISCAVTDRGRTNDRRSLDNSYMPGSLIWNDHKKTALYLNSEGTLKKISGKEVSDMSGDGTITDLLYVQNDGGYVYTKDKAFYYGSAFDKSAAPLGEVSYGSIKEAVRSGGYIYRPEGRNVVAVSDDGSFTKDLGICERLWCGRL